MQSSWLRDALSEIDQASERFTFVGVAAAQPYLRIQANGPLGSTEVSNCFRGSLACCCLISASPVQIDYPDKDVLEMFDCENTVTFRCDDRLAVDAEHSSDHE